MGTWKSFSICLCVWLFQSSTHSQAVQNENLEKQWKNLYETSNLRQDDFLNVRDRKGHRRSARFTPLTTAIGEQSNANLQEYERLIGYGLPKSWILALLQSKRHPSCTKPVVPCYFKTKFRTIDGTCNNVFYPNWGTSYHTFQRLFPPQYADGFNKQKGLPPHQPLPSARLVSTTIHPDLIHPDATLTNFVPQIGQFLDHDFALTIEDDRKCCSSEKDHPDCWPIQIPEDDYFYSNLTKPQNCMDFTRSTAYCFPTESGVREQFNIDTSYIDASQVYGSENERSKYLREFQGGRLATSSKNSKLLPTVKEVEERYKTKIEFMGKFLAGDDRVNEMPGLSVLHTLWVREHNRIADMISSAKPKLTDEVIFQETRRIVIAEWQNVIFGHFLTTVLGNDTMRRYKLDLGAETAVSDYNPTIDATLFHNFATAAYRFGHTFLNGVIRLFRGLSEVGSYLVRDNYFDSFQLERNNTEGYDLILGGLLTQNAQTYDRFVSVDFTNFLFKEKHENFGADLVARNIQRSRDHAISGYGNYRTHCGLTPLTDWARRPLEISKDTWEKLKSVYTTPQDIELFPGGLAETPIPETASGPTFNCLKAKQFQKLKYGDRFFFTHRNQSGSFTKKQLKNIRRRTLGDIICENSQVQQTPVNVFRIAGPSNPWIDCNDQRRTKLDISEFI